MARWLPCPVCCPHSQHKYPTAEKTKTGKTFFAKHDETGIKKTKYNLSFG